MRGLPALLFSLLASLPAVAGPAAELARAIRENSFDPDQCYRVRDLSIVKEDIKIYLADGHLILSRPVAGRRIAAVFVADVEGGDAEVILMPPDRAERRSLAHYAGEPNLDEHFRSAVFLFTGDDAAALLRQLAANPADRKTPEAGALLERQWTPVLRNIGESYQTRLVLDLAGGPARHPGLFAALVDSSHLGTFDLLYDPEAAEQILAGQLVTREDRMFFDSWTSFASRSARERPHPPSGDLKAGNYRIEASIGADLGLSAVTRIEVEPLADGMAAVPFDITPQMTVSAATIDGKPAEVLQRESARGDATRNGNSMFLVIPPEPLHRGHVYEFEFHHSGNVIRDAGDRVLYVTARGNWYPIHGSGFADYDLLFRYPRDLDLAAPGDVAEDRLDGDTHITRLRTPVPIRMAGFNLGDYARARVASGPYTVEVCANRALERSLRPNNTLTIQPLGHLDSRQGGTPGAVAQHVPDMPINPLARLTELASEVGAALEFMAARFGPPALPHLTVSPIPGTFGQGFPGLIYLSTLAYLKALPPQASGAPASVELFFRQLMQAHETAHQWWGNRVTSPGYRDAWLQEALANYSALLYLEKSKGQRAADVMLDSYRTDLLSKGPDGHTEESIGPLTMGIRLETSESPDAWRAITYGKGTWILQMLRRYMGDERFTRMLGEILHRYDQAEISTDQFRRLAAEFLPPKSDDPQLETFFDQWVYGTGIPALKLSYKVIGKAPALKLLGVVTQSDVDDNFAALVPIEILTRGRSMTQWVRCSNDPTNFTVALTQPPIRVTLDPDRAVLRR